MNWKKCFCVAVLASGAAFAQGWEAGLIGGFAYSPKLDVDGRTGSAKAGFKDGVAVGVYGGEDTYRYWGGEARYLYRSGDLSASSGGTSTSFGAATHILTGDILGYFKPTGARVRPFIIFGGGIKFVRGTGSESAAQPLGNFVALTHTQQVLGVADVGAGFKMNLRKHFRLRIEAHDYISTPPRKVLAAAPGASLSGILNDIVGTVSLAYTWQ
jgi:hypothetical protein